MLAFLSCLLSFLLIPSLNTLEFHKRFILQPNSYLELQNTFIEDLEISFSSGTMTGTFSISLPADKNPPNANFDVFQFDNNKNVDDILCYKRAIINEDYSAKCSFLNDTKKTLLSTPSFGDYTYKFNDLQYLSTFINSYFIDNTRFPSDSSSSDPPTLVIDSVYTIEVDSSASYFIKTIGVAVALGVILIIFVVGLLYLMIKYKEVKKKYKDEILNLSTNERSFITGHGASRKKGSKDNKNESFEESKAESSINNCN